MRSKFLFSFVLVFLLPTALLPVIASAQNSRDNTDPKPPGKLVDIGGRKLHLNCTGKGRFTVIAEAGAGDFSFDWGLVQPKVARFARICTYDRAGYAWSDAGPFPRTTRQIAHELHTALKNARIKPPYVMMGHSLGGIIVRTFAGMYPNDVAGMILVDSSHEDQLISLFDPETKQEKIVRLREMSEGKEIPPVQTFFRAKARAEKTRSNEASSSSTTSGVNAPFDKLPPELQKMRIWARQQPDYNPSRSGEFDFLGEELTRIFEERRVSPQTLGNIPLIVLSRGQTDYPGAREEVRKQLKDSFERLQDDLTKLSGNSKRIVSASSGHHIHLDDPDIVAEAVKQVTTAIRKRSKLY